MSAAPRLRWAVQERTLGAVEDLDWAMDELAVFRAAAAEGRALDGLIRVYVPEPTVAFGQRDARLPGFEAAAAASKPGSRASRWPNATVGSGTYTRIRPSRALPSAAAARKTASSSMAQSRSSTAPRVRSCTAQRSRGAALTGRPRPARSAG